MSGTLRSIVVALGSNLGDSRRHLRRAVQELSGVITLVKVSNVYRTEPVGCEPGSRSFLNMAILGFSNRSPLELLRGCESVERLLGRPERRQRNGPRTIDVDLLFVGLTVSRVTTLTLPHPRWQEREFVLAPLREIAPWLADPASGSPVSQIQGEGSVFRAGRLYSEDWR